MQYAIVHPQYRDENPTDEASTCRAFFHSADNCPAGIVLKVAPGQRMHLLGEVHISGVGAGGERVWR